MKLYASDGVFMAQNLPSSVGASAVRKAYETVFKNIKLSVKFSVAEVVQVAPESRPPAQATMAKRSSREHRLDGPRGSGDGGRGLPHLCRLAQRSLFLQHNGRQLSPPSRRADQTSGEE